MLNPVSMRIMLWGSGQNRFLLSYVVISHRDRGLELVAQSYLEKRKAPSPGKQYMPSFYTPPTPQWSNASFHWGSKNEQIYLLDNFTMIKQSPVGKTNRRYILYFDGSLSLAIIDEQFKWQQGKSFARMRLYFMELYHLMFSLSLS